MLVVISPAKRLDWSAVDGITTTRPEFQQDATYLAGVAGKLSKPRLQALMSISPDLAKLNKDRFAAFRDTPDAIDERPAARAFAGDTYAGLEAGSLDLDELAWAQDHLRILSGLYGLLRPLDAIQPYRLEMGSRLKTRVGPSLYAYWSDRLARTLERDAQALGTDVLINCASQEYFGAVPADGHGLRVVTPVFLEDRPGGPKIVSFFAKKARGAMARYIIQHRLTDPVTITAFDTGGYSYQKELSSPERPVFLRGSDPRTSI